MSALPFELLSYLIRDRSVANHRLLRSADRTVIETRASQNIRDRLLYVRRTLDKRRHVPGAHAECGLTRRISRPYQSRPASCEDHRGLAVLHQRFSSLERRILEADDRVAGQAVLDGGLAHNARRFGDGLRR